MVRGEPERMTRRDLGRHQLDRRENQRATETHRDQRATVRASGETSQEAEGHRVKGETETDSDTGQ